MRTPHQPLRHRLSRQRRALITGGAGFVGSHLAEALLARGYRVTALDNLSTGRLGNIEHLLDGRRFELLVGDLADTDLLGEATNRSDVVFHLAAAVGVKLILADPRASIETNVAGTRNVLEAALGSGAKVLVASTSEVYGKADHVPQREDDDVVLGPTVVDRWSYAAAKMLDEFLALSYHRETGLPAVCFRLFNTVGPRQTGDYGMVIPRFVEAAMRGEPLPVYGDGRQLRCFLHVQDAVEAIVQLAECRAAVGEVVNVGSVEQVSIIELAQRVLGKLDGRSHGALVSLVPYEQAFPNGRFEDISRRLPDISKIRALTGWQPSHTLDDILADVIGGHGADKVATLALAEAT
jgi:UDP-glucose 4-epimerase